MNDLYREHVLHKTFENDCSTCFSENLRIQDRRDYYRKREELLGITNESIMNPWDGSSPWDFNPLE